MIPEERTDPGYPKWHGYQYPPPFALSSKGFRLLGFCHSLDAGLCPIGVQVNS
jgi:hypothetical protein